MEVPEFDKVEFDTDETLGDGGTGGLVTDGCTTGV
jgi:hypothetical protein